MTIITMMSGTKTPLRKTTSLLLKNQSHFSMDQHHHLPRQQSTGLLGRRPSRRSPHAGAELFPTSPEVPPIGDGIFHVTHPQHPITQTRLPDLFTCGACKEYGAGERFACTECDYQLHDFCALAPATLKRHPIHPLHSIVFITKPVKGGILKSRCDICAKPTKGCVFKCHACTFQMHPCCAMLSTQINISVHPHTLRLLPGLSPSSDPTGLSCGECNRRRSGRVYHCTTCDYHLHAVCAKNMVNGLEANGIKGLNKPSMVVTAARVASQVVIEFIGGLIEGIGEGVGQVIIQTATRGRCCNNRSTRTE